jgi:type 1 glutamine amidotransferase
MDGIPRIESIVMHAPRALLTGFGRILASCLSVVAHRRPPLLPRLDHALFARAAVLVLSIALPQGAWEAASAPLTGGGPAFAALVFTKTSGFRHDSIPAGITAIKSLGEQHNFRVDASEDGTVFTDENLARYQVVIFFSTTGDVLAPGEQAAFERFIRRGGGFVGVHAAVDSGYDWPWYGGLVGTYFDSHPDIQPALLKVVDATHVSTKHLPAQWTRTDEWYNFRADPSPYVRVLIQIDETTYSGGRMGAHHPISWCHAYEGGRAWYTAMGHTTETYQDPLFLSHLLGGIRWAAGTTPE